MNNYAIIKTGGKQYRVQPGDTIRVERLPGLVGTDVEFTDVLLVADGGQVVSGNPTVEGAKVIAFVDGEGKGEKVVIFKYKAKTRSRKKNGHRQPYSQVTIKEIQSGRRG